MMKHPSRFFQTFSGSFLSLLLLCLGSCGNPSAPDLSDSQLIIDGRTLAEHNPDNSLEDHEVVVQASVQAGTYWQSQNSVYEKDYRVMDIVTGSFTGAGKQQTAVLYLMSLWPRCCTNMGLVILEDNQLVLNSVFEGGRQQLFSIGDLNSDERDELILIGSFGMGGSSETSMEIISFSDKGIISLTGHTLLSDDCATLRNDSQIHAWLVTLNTGQSTQLKAEQFVSACENKDWQSTGIVEPLSIAVTQNVGNESGFIILQRN